MTLALALMTFVFTHVEGIRHNGPVRYFKSWIPEVPKAMLPLIVPLEILGQFMRLISLSVRLFANMLAGHMLILTFIGLIFVLESWSCSSPFVGPARDGSSTSSRSSSSSRSRRSSSPPCPPSTSARPSSPSTKEEPQCSTTVLAHADTGDVADAGKAIALALGIGLGSLGAGIGIGNIFGVDDPGGRPPARAARRAPGDQWLGFALTEAVVFYGLIGGLLAFVLV